MVTRLSFHSSTGLSKYSRLLSRRTGCRRGGHKRQHLHQRGAELVFLQAEWLNTNEPYEAENCTVCCEKSNGHLVHTC